MLDKPTKKEYTASRHPSKTAKPPRKPTPESDGFRPDSHAGAQALKNWIERDDPNRNKS